jgi:large subunit ribosomal protein L6
MSRIGKQPVQVPAGVKATISGDTVTVTGPAGTLSMTHRPEVKVRWGEAEKALFVSIDEADAENAAARAHWGTTRATLRNMVQGAEKGYEKTLEVVGVGWTASLAGKNLKLVVGFANPILLAVPAGLKVSVDKQFIKIQGADKQLVGQFAAEVRSNRPPEPYNGKGIKYTTEVIRRKQGKQFGAAGAA